MLFLLRGDCFDSDEQYFFLNASVTSHMFIITIEIQKNPKLVQTCVLHIIVHLFSKIEFSEYLSSKIGCGSNLHKKQPVHICFRFIAFIFKRRTENLVLLLQISYCFTMCRPPVGALVRIE